MKSSKITISAGQYRGRKISLPPAVAGHRHFTPALLKEAVFQILENRQHKGTFWDLCSGSGQMGLEALSRGYSPVHLVELDRQRFQWLKREVKGYPVILHNKDFLRTVPQILEAPSVCFLDLPYSFWDREMCPRLDTFLGSFQKHGEVGQFPFILVQAPQRYTVSGQELKEFLDRTFSMETRDYRGRFLILLEPLHPWAVT